MSQEEEKQQQQNSIPNFVQERIRYFNSLADLTPKIDIHPISISILKPNSNDENDSVIEVIQANSGEITPKKIWEEKYKDNQVVSCSVDGKLWDIQRPLVSDCKLSFISFDDERGKSVFWHSSAHILAEAIKIVLGQDVVIGGDLENGFYYDFDQINVKIDQEQIKKIENVCQSISKKIDFEHKMITKEQAMELFHSNEYIKDILSKRNDSDSLVSIYRAGSFIDVCEGPHICNGSIIKAWNIIDSSSSLWNEKNLTRIRGISFPSQAQLKEYKKFIEEASKRDHRKLGIDHQLFFFHEWSPACAFFYQDGCHIYNALIQMIREQYHKRGYIEVITPNLFYDDLFKKSGHWEHYRENMYHFPIKEESQGQNVNVNPDEKCECCAKACREMGLKPMNCPGHCLVFRSRDRSYKELPIRMAEFGVLHRHESSGALSGLKRTVRFVQDDCHIFARHDQIGEEIAGILDFMREVYSYFNMDLEFNLSTINMNKYMGDLKVWEQATELLRKALVDGHHNFKEMPGEAAFYGPKIDFFAKDCFNRRHQLATIQLDFQLPEKFDLVYYDNERKPHRPVMIHRAVLGSIERFMGVATEHFNGRFPFWCSPHQIVLIPQNMSKIEHIEMCKKWFKILFDEWFTVMIDDSSNSMAKKIQMARSVLLAHIIIVVGDKECKENKVCVRWWDSPKNVDIEPIPFDDFLKQIRDFRHNKKLNH